MAYIYKITNTINGKCYIGKTESTPELRFLEHIRDSKKERCKDRPLYRAFNKYGVENFTIEMIEETDSPEEREVFFIQQFDSYGRNGYNATIGGDGRAYIDRDAVIACYQESHTFKEVAEKMNVSVDTVSDIIQKSGIEIKPPQEQFKKAVLQIDIETGDVVAEYGSISEAAEAVGRGKVHQSNISRVCQGKRQTSLGFKWAYK